MNDAIFELILNETIKDISRYKEVDEDFFVECFMNNVKLFASDEVLTEAGMKAVWDAAKNVKFQPRGKNLIVGRDTNLTDASKYAAKKGWEGTKKVGSWISKKWNSGKQTQPITSQTTQSTNTPTQSSARPNTQSQSTNYWSNFPSGAYGVGKAVKAGVAAKNNIPSGAFGVA